MLFSEWALITEAADLICEEYFFILENSGIEPLDWQAAQNVANHIIMRQSRGTNRPDPEFLQLQDNALKTFMLAVRKLGSLKAGELPIRDESGKPVKMSDEVMQAIESGGKGLHPEVRDIIKKGNDSIFYLGDMIKNNLPASLTGYKKGSPQNDELLQHVADTVVRRLVQKTNPARGQNKLKKLSKISAFLHKLDKQLGDQPLAKPRPVEPGSLTDVVGQRIDQVRGQESDEFVSAADKIYTRLRSMDDGPEKNKRLKELKSALEVSPYWSDLPSNPISYAKSAARDVINKKRSAGKAKVVADVEAVPAHAGGNDAVKDIEHAQNYASDFPDVYRQGIQHMVQYGRGEPTPQGLPLNVLAALIAKIRFKGGEITELSVDPKNQGKRAGEMRTDKEIHSEVERYLRDFFQNPKLKLSERTFDKASSYSHNYLRKWTMDPSRRHSKVPLPDGGTAEPMLNRFDLDSMRVVNKKVGDFKQGRKGGTVPLEEV